MNNGFKEKHAIVTGQNPVMDTDLPDPDVIRVGDTYYMVTTTMHFCPGCEILRSFDLINWEHETYVYDRFSDVTEERKLSGKGHIFGKGMWAASLRYHEGVFYVVFVANDTQKTYLYKSSSINGPWEKSEIRGFYHDASLLFDEGRAYIVYGNTDIYLTELTPELDGPAEGGLHRLIVSDKGNKILGYEGSHIYRLFGRYFLFLIHSAKDKWMRRQACFVSDSLTGEFTGGDVLSDDMGLPGRGVAQGGIVDTPGGEYFAVLFQDSGAVGRIPVVVPVRWEENEYGRFPVFGSSGKVPQNPELPSTRPEYEYEPLFGSDDFSKGYFGEKENPDKKHFGCFGLKSFWQFSHIPDLSLITADREKGMLRIKTDKVCSSLCLAKNVLTQRTCRPGCFAEVTVDASDLCEGDAAGLCIYQGDYMWIGVTKRSGKTYISLTTNKSTGDTWTLSDGPGSEKSLIPAVGDIHRFRIEAFFDDEGDRAFAYVVTDDGCTAAGDEHPLRFRLDHFTGARFGLFALSTKTPGGSAFFKDFVYGKIS